MLLCWLSAGNSRIEKQCVLEFTESLQHTSKSVERYAFLMWILCIHTVVCFTAYLLNVRIKETHSAQHFYWCVAKILQIPVRLLGHARVNNRQSLAFTD